MAIVLFVVLGLAIAGAGMYFSYKSRQKRVQAVMALGQRAGLDFSATDVDHIVDMPFTLFTRGDGRGVELVLSGTHNGAPLQLFDYWYYDETYNAQTHSTSRSYHRFTCGIATITAACPHLSIGHENFFSRIGSHVGVHDIEFESDEFNKQFRVKGSDQKFAFCVLDGQMMEWLQGSDAFDTVEVVGPWVLVATGKLDPQRWLELGTWLDAFRSHIPQVVYSEYPAK